jgi:uracil-DNA glycosylase
VAGEGNNGDAAAPDTVLPSRTEVLSLAVALRTALRFHKEMGVDRYPLTPGLRRYLEPRQMRPGVSKTEAAKPISVSPDYSEAPRVAEKGVAAVRLQALQKEIENCTLCCMVSARQGVVTGFGKVGAALMVVGEYSQQEEAFSGAVQFGVEEDALLENMMRAIGLSPEDVYVTNAVKCCPLSAQVPPDACRQACRAYLAREVELVQPKVVCAMGDAAALSLVGSEESVFRLRGRFHSYRVSGETEKGYPVMVTFHPRTLRKNVDLKKAAWQDLQMIQRLLRER